jgi:ABC-2 type transport system permease protein
MSSQLNPVPELFQAQSGIAKRVSETRPLYWSVRRELWENRSIYFAPLIVAGVFLLGFLITLVHLPARMRLSPGLDPMQQREAIAMPYDMAAAVLMLTLMLVGALYCLDALYGERRDRSIVFWKSLPVSDLTTVLSKASIPFVVLPLVTFAITISLQWVMLLVSSVVVLGSGQSVVTLWTQVSFLQMSWLLLYHLITMHTLWPAPLYGYLLLVSGWARRAVFLWAAVPLLAIAVMEKLIFNSSKFVLLLQSRLTGTGAEAVTMPGTFPTDPMTHITLGKFLSTPGLWIGLAVTLAFLAAAVRLRRYRVPI